MPAPTLSDGVVTLRAHRPDDAARVLEQCQDPTSIEFTTIPVPYAAADAEIFVGTLAPQGWADGSEWIFAVEVEGRFGGTVSLRVLGADRAEVAYGAHPDVRGTGTLERALRLLLTWGFAEQGLQTVVWYANRGNWASRRLAWRVGFSFDGTLRRYLPQRGELHDGWAGTLLADEPLEPRTRWLENPVVEGERVRLRPFRTDDVARLVEALGDAEAQQWLRFLPRDPSLEDGLRYLDQVTERLANDQTITWVMAETGTDRLMGVVGLYRLAEEPELGYLAHPEARGRGLMTEAGGLALDHAFGALELPRVAAYVSVPNTASRRVLERLGFQPTGVRRGAARTGAGEAVDLAGYDLLAGERSREKANTSTTSPSSASSTPTSSGER